MKEKINKFLDKCFYPGAEGESPAVTHAREVVQESRRKREGLRRLSRDLRSGAVYQYAPAR